MGTCISKQDKYVSKRDNSEYLFNQLEMQFNAFIKLNCSEDPTSFVDVSTLISLFAYYLQYNAPYIKYSYDPIAIGYVMDNIYKLCIQRGYSVTSGLRPFNYCIIGLSINKIEK